jgi:cysteine-rich repeat protein
LFTVAPDAQQRLRQSDVTDVIVDAAGLAALARNPATAVLHDIPLADGSRETFTVTSFSPFADGAQVVEFDGHTQRSVQLPDVVAFMGESTSDPTDSIVLTISRGTSARAIIRHDASVVSVIGYHGGLREPLRHDLMGPRSIEAARPAAGCDGTDKHAGITGTAQRMSSGAPGTPRITDERYKIRMLVDVGNQLYNGPFGGDSGYAATYIGEMMAGVSALYQRDVKLVPELLTVVVWTTLEPFDGGTSSAQLNLYTSYNYNRFAPRDLAHYVTNKGYGGRAWLDALCTGQYENGVSNISGAYSFPTGGYVFDINIVAHEIGHNLGADHTHCFFPPLDHCANESGCYTGPIEQSVGETMSYCSSIDMGFRAAVSGRIRSAVEPGSYCLGNMGHWTPACGDGVRDPGEQCDDGNADEGDCCTSACVLQSSGVGSCDDFDVCTEDYECPDSSCFYQPVDCDDSNPCTADYCDAQNPTCAHFAYTSGYCDDGLYCTVFDTCTAGVCVGGEPLDCGDDNPCTADTCDENADTCAYTDVPPSNSCAAPGTTSLTFKGGSKKSLTWKWGKGPLVQPSAFGNPTTDFANDFGVCIYDETDQLVSSLRAPAGPITCNGKFCWKATGTKGYKYGDGDATPDGLTGMSVKAGDAGKSKMSAKGKGSALPLPSLPIPAAGSLRVQLRRSGGSECWESLFAPPFGTNDGAQFSDKQ